MNEMLQMNILIATMAYYIKYFYFAFASKIERLG